MIPKVVSIDELAHLIGAESELIEKWLVLFEEYFSATAVHPYKGEPRIFTQDDVRRLLVIGYTRDWWAEEQDLDYSDVYGRLNSSEEYDDRYIEAAYLRVPLFQPMPENPEEMATYTLVVGENWTGSDLGAIAQSYKLAGDVLADSALETEEPWKLAYPILFNYRHSLELFLKAIIHPDKPNHDIASLIKLLEEQSGKTMSREAKAIFDQFVEIDRKSTTFRYGEQMPKDDTMINLYQLKYVMEFLAKGFSKIQGYPYPY
jgi:hypothetical protein